jgi:hypothetical protein
MRVAIGALTLCLSLAVSAAAQQTEPPVSVEKVRVALQHQPVLKVPPLVSPSTPRLGIITFLPPDTNGEMVKVNVPVGELVTRATRAVSTARRRRAERKAHKEVLRALEEFEAKQPKP